MTRLENTGVDFYTDLAVDRSAPSVTAKPPLGDVSATVEGFQNIMLFLAWLEDGYASSLEGATVVDSTVGLDLREPPVSPRSFRRQCPG